MNHVPLTLLEVDQFYCFTHRACDNTDNYIKKRAKLEADTYFVANITSRRETEQRKKYVDTTEDNCVTETPHPLAREGRR